MIYQKLCTIWYTKIFNMVLYEFSYTVNSSTVWTIRYNMSALLEEKKRNFIPSINWTRNLTLEMELKIGDLKFIYSINSTYSLGELKLCSTSSSPRLTQLISQLIKSFFQVYTYSNSWGNKTARQITESKVVANSGTSNAMWANLVHWSKYLKRVMYT